METKDIAEQSVRKCGEDFRYCNGDCENCHVNKFSYTKSTEREE